MRVSIERLSEDIRYVQFGRYVRRRNYTLANGVANPVVTDFDVFRALVHRVVEVDQCNRTLVINAKVDRRESLSEKFYPYGVFPPGGKKNSMQKGKTSPQSPPGD